MIIRAAILTILTITQAVPPGSGQVSASMSNPHPGQRTWETLTTRLAVEGKPAAGATMTAVWRYRTINERCAAVADGKGTAICMRWISRATHGYAVKVDVTFRYGGTTYTGRTGFTPR